MKTTGILLSYLAATSAFAGILFGGVFWLIQPDPSITRLAPVPAIPPRIAESIERKKLSEATPALSPVAVEAPPQEPMSSSNASLVHMPLTPVVHQLPPPDPVVKRNRKSQTVKRYVVAGYGAPAALPAVASLPAVAATTGRTDFPY